MKLVEATIRIPAQMEQWICEDEYLSALDRNAMLLYPLVRSKTLSHGKVAELLGISKTRLIDLYANLGIPYFNSTAAEVDDEVELYNNLKGR